MSKSQKTYTLLLNNRPENTPRNGEYEFSSDPSHPPNTPSHHASGNHESARPSSSVYQPIPMTDESDNAETQRSEVSITEQHQVYMIYSDTETGYESISEQPITERKVCLQPVSGSHDSHQPTRGRHVCEFE